MKEVLISIKPKWCELIANGKKTIELRKTRPKIEEPFKCYIYCTKEKYKGKYLHTSNKEGRLLGWKNPHDCEITVQPENFTYIAHTCRGKVIGEFVCNAIYEIIKECGKYIVLEDDRSIIECLTNYVAKQSCIDFDCIDKYLKGNHGYGWQISDLKIYDKPKGLSHFVKPCDRENDCCACRRWNYSAKNCEDSITTPPKTFCYCEHNPYAIRYVFKDGKWQKKETNTE